MGKPAEVKDGEAENKFEVRLLPVAVEKVRKLLTERNRLDDYLRIFVSGGGCSGMQYGMSFETAPKETDAIFETGGVRVVVDPISMMYLSGITIDYVENMMGGGFKIDNPNAVSSCGCGHSFRTSGSPDTTAGGCSSCS